MRLSNAWKPVWILAAFVFCLLAHPTPSAAQSWSNGYGYRRSITIDHTKVPNTDQSNFPVLISGTYSYLATTSNGGNVTSENGYDIIFTSDSAGTNVLNFEQESYNPTTGAVIYWVNIPTVSHSTDTVFYMFYYDSSITTNQSSPTEVWDSNFKGIWHLPNGSTLSANDSTSNGNNTTNNSNLVTAVAGEIDGAAGFNATNGQFLTASDSGLPLGATPRTLSAWFKMTNSSSPRQILFYGKSGTTGEMMSLRVLSSTSIGFEGWSADLDTTVSTLSTGTWYHLVGTYDGTYSRIYLNGSLIAGPTAESLNTVSNALYIGHNTFDGSNNWYGSLDELRISNIARSADWITTEYNNQSSPATFYGVSSSTEVGSGTPSISSVSPTSGAVGASVTITGTHFQSTQSSSTVTFNGTSATPSSWSDTSIVVPVPSGASPGDVVVTVFGVPSNSVFFMVPTTWSNGYAYRRAITINHTKVTNADETNFPVLFSGTYAYLANTGSSGYVTNSNGYDIIFTSDAAGTTSLSYERETYSSSTGSVIFWVKVPSASHTSNETVLYMFYGNSSVTTDQSSPSGVWDTNFMGVWHLANGTTLSATDSTSNGNNGSLVNSPSAVSGQIDGGANFTSSSSQYITVPDTSNLKPANLTFSFWMKRSGNQQQFAHTIGKGTGSGSPYGAYYFQLNESNSDSTEASLYVGTTNNVANQISYPSGTFGDGSWYYVAGTFNSSTNVLTGYKNGQSVGTTTASVGTISYDTGGLSFGRQNSYGQYFNGSLDEVRVSNIPRSADWIAMEYNNQSNPSAFYSVWAAASSGGGSGGNPGISSLSPTSGAVGASVTISGTNFNGSQNDSTVTFNGTSATPTSWSDTSIVVPAPSGATTGNVVVMVSGVSSNGASFTVVSAPSITSLSTTTGAIGAAVTITGTNFGSTQGSGTVSFNGTAASVTSWSATSIAVTVPSAATTGNVVVYASGVNSNGSSFTVLPTISSLSPSTTAVGATVTITGTVFGATQGSGSVTFNTTTASVTSWSATSIVVTVPTGATTGNVVVVANSQTSNGVSFTVVPAPSVTSLTPSSAPIGGSVIVTGTNFGATQGSGQVKFGTIVASVGSWSATSITVTVPLGTTTGSLTVAASGVTSNSSSFTLLASGSVTSISPTTGLIGSSLTINGTGFGPTQSNSIVTLNNVVATSITSWSDTQIVAVVPVGDAPGPVYVTVAAIASQGPTFTPTTKAVVIDSLSNSSYYLGAVSGGQWHATDSQGSGCSSCTVRGTNHYAFDSSGNVTSMTDPLGNVTTYTYDSANNVLSQTVPVTGTTTATTSYTYNSFNEVLTVTDPLGNVTTNAYDSLGNLTSVTSPVPTSGVAASVTHFAYNSLGELTSITDPLGNVTTMTYTTAGRIATITDAQSNVTTYAYDSHGNRTSVTDALSHQTTFAYDSGDRLTTITYPDSTTSTFTYDSRGRRTSATDQNSETTTYAYDTADRLTSVTDAASHVTYYGYDTENNLTSIQDANSNTTAFTYDAYGRVTNTNFPSSLSETYAYDADNNLTSKTDRKGQTITYVYDALNRLTSKTYPDTTAVDYTYDLVGKIQSVNDPTGTYAFAYDNMGRLIGTTTSYSFLTSRSFTNAYTYDAASNRTGFTDPESGSTTYSYDTLNRLTTLAPPSAFSTSSFGFSYDALSRRTQMTRPNSVATNYSYDNLSRLSSVLHQLSGSTIDGASYTLDSGGNRTAKVDHLAAVTSNYTYDAIYQLTQATQGATTTESYTYDPVGNRTASLGVSSYTTNASNEMTANSNASYTYDSNGNMLTKTVGSNTTSYTWDYENRLTSVTLPGSGGTVSFKYDPFGRRIEKSSSATTIVFAYDGDNLIEEANSSGAVVARYTQTQNIDEPLAMLRSSATSYYNADGLGSVTSLTNSAGAVAQTYTYDSYGTVTATSGSVTNPFQYTARESDAQTALYYYRARYYDSSTGRFLTEDPLRYDPTSFYSYVGGNPVIWADPLGLYQCAKGATCNFQPDLNDALLKFEKCTGNDITVTCGNNGHPPTDSHFYGWAVDIGHNSNPWLDRQTAEDCFSKSFPQGILGSYAQQEYNSENKNDGWHYHFQYFPSRSGNSGFPKGIQPHGK